MNEIEQLTAERDEAREWVRKLTKENTLTCVYCGQEYPPGTPTHGAQVLTDHIKVCPKHPMRKLEMERERLRIALWGLIGAVSVAELKGMKEVIRILPSSDEEKRLTINGIDALLSLES